MEFHISRRAREKYRFEESLFSYDGNVIFANFHAARIFAQKMNAQRDLVSFPENTIKASHLNALGLIDEIFHHVFSLYQDQKSPDLLKNTIQHMENALSSEDVDALLEIFIHEYPPQAVFGRKLKASDYLAGVTKGVSNRELVLEELLMLWLTLQNPALNNYAELFIENNLLEDPRFSRLMKSAEYYLATQPTFGPEDLTILELLKTPARKVPDSITGQLEYIREHWISLIGDYLFRLLTSLDMIKEENKLSFMGPGKIPIPVYDAAEFTRAGGAGIEPEAFSADREWMPRLVLMAKNSYVWLDQLSRKYEQPITRLDQIPLSELETLSKWGVTGLWLIGLWERSPASAQIKKLCGNPDAISSAYSLYSYRIAEDLGGESAYEVLRDNAAKFGIRLASDMVPNHMGIDSEWVINNPDRFLSLDHCPYPAYSFSGQNLSSDPNITIQIEDHYFDKTDAAVVFRRTDNRSGETRYIYHGNDGTSMPWNDTAQLNYLNPEVREAVIQTILEVAKKFPIIRFDAAMTLAKKHYQRLWFPQPGLGGAIPSRSEYGLTMSAFNKAMPVEFWREVVDRAAVEAPDTLLLAEAFWLMEGYFVRTLGMHRVYNSAFMHMLRNEDDAGYRKIIKNTLEFEPEILKRFVNFMNNPDEKTAVEQFGKGDKYFGICMMMVTMPGLPMLGHGQIEGYAEKYGMEFRKAYWDEHTDPNLVARHEWEIFPLLHQRRLFAGVENFAFYDFSTPGGITNEHVYAYSNYYSGKAALVIYNNNYQQTEGWIHYSSHQPRKSGINRGMNQVALNSALQLTPDHNAYIVFRDQITGLSYLRPAGEFLNKGMHFDLRGYEHHTFLDFQVVTSDPAHDYSRLYSFIGDQGVPDIDRALNELVLKPVHEPLKQLLNYGHMHYLVQKYTKPGIYLEELDEREIKEKVTNFLQGIKAAKPEVNNMDAVREEICNLFKAVLEMHNLGSKLHMPSGKKILDIESKLLSPLAASEEKWFTLLALALLSPIGKLVSQTGYEDISLSWNDELQLIRQFHESLVELGCEEDKIQQLTLLLRIGVAKQDWYEDLKKENLTTILQNWFSTPEIQYMLNVNRHKDILWYNREAFNELLWWLWIVPVLKVSGDSGVDSTSRAELTLSIYEMINSVKKVEVKSEYQVEKLLELAGKAGKNS